MTREEAMKLRVGDRVRWIQDGAIGEVVELLDAGLVIDWPDQVHAGIAFHDCSRIEPYLLRGNYDT